MFKKMLIALTVVAGLSVLGSSADAYPPRWRAAGVYYAPVNGYYYGYRGYYAPYGYYGPYRYYGRPYFYGPRVVVAPYRYSYATPMYYPNYGASVYVY